MKRTHSLLLIAAFLMRLGNALAAPSAACAPRTGEPFEGSIPPNLHLLAACQGAPHLGKGEAHWVFRGQVTLSGELRFTLGEWGTATLHPDASTRSQLPSTVEFVQFDDRRGNPSMRIPLSTRADTCFTSRARIQFSELAIVSDGSDESGNWVREYKVLSLSKWAECKSQ